MLKLHIWDTAGQEKYSPLSNHYYRGAHAAIICYSVTDDSTFASLDDWVKKLEDNCNIEKVLKIIVGNKSDASKDERRVDIKSGKAYSERR